MTRAASTAYLGGIGLMLEVAHICPRCGKRLSDAPTAGAQHLSTNGCRPTVFAALPEPERAGQDDELPPLPASRRIHDFEVPIPRGHGSVAFAGHDPLSEPVPSGRGVSRALAIPWLRPPDLGEVL